MNQEWLQANTTTTTSATTASTSATTAEGLITCIKLRQDSSEYYLVIGVEWLKAIFGICCFVVILSSFFTITKVQSTILFRTRQDEGFKLRASKKIKDTMTLLAQIRASLREFVQAWANLSEFARICTSLCESEFGLV